jgi:hypothetical protein
MWCRKQNCFDDSIVWWALEDSVEQRESNLWVHGKKWYETELQCIMYTASATYLNADPRTTLKTLNCLTSPANDQPNLGKPNEMLSFSSWYVDLWHLENMHHFAFMTKPCCLELWLEFVPLNLGHTCDHHDHLVLLMKLAMDRTHCNDAASG